MLGGIVGFEMQIESLEGKFKLGQERSDADKQGLLEHLGQAKRRERSLHDLHREFLQALTTRIDDCANESGGPLLRRRLRIPNWSDVDAMF